MKDTSEKESSTQDPKWLEEFHGKLDEAAQKKGFRLQVKDLESSVLILNPLRGLEEKLRRKAEEAEKKPSK